MTLKQFIEKYKGKKVDFDGVYGAQCVDLFRQYCKDVLKIPVHTGAVEGAKDLFINHEKMPIQQQYFDKKDIAKIGDVVIFGAIETNKYGHVAIVAAVEECYMIVFEQDGFKQDGAKLSLCDYSRVLGFLRRKK